MYKGTQRYRGDSLSNDFLQEIFLHDFLQETLSNRELVFFLVSPLLLEI